MRALVSAILICLLLEACGSKGALVLPPKPDGEPQTSVSSSKPK